MPNSGQGMPTDFFAFAPIMFILMAAILIVPFWIVFSKAGYSKWLSLLMVIPLVNVITLYWFAISKWPSLREHG